MFLGGRTFRAFRPSRYARLEEPEEENTEFKQAKIQIYMRRAEAGQPLFESANVVKALGGGKETPPA